jgi:hypothetical protein
MLAYNKENTMDPATITLILTILVKWGPEAYLAAVNLFTKKTPVTPEDFQVLANIVNKPLHTPLTLPPTV